MFRLHPSSRFWLNLRMMSVSSSISNDILVDSVNSKRIITLNRPKALNALNLNMIRTIFSMLKAWKNDSSVSMVMIKGAGTKAFCAGGDVLAISRSAFAKDPSNTLYKDFFREEYVLNHEIGSYPLPYVAFIGGVTMGGGCGLSVHGSFRIATEGTVLSMPETSLGLFTDVGGSYFLPRLRHNLGIFLALTGYRLEGADAYHAGLATHFIRSSCMNEVENDLTNLCDDKVSKESINDVLDRYQEVNMPMFSLEPYLSSIEAICTEKNVESIQAKMHESDQPFLRHQAFLLTKMSPLSLKVTLRQLQNGANMEFSDVFPMEYRLAVHLVNEADFHEGCRAILIDKDRKPKWKPQSLTEVTDEMVNRHFLPLSPTDELKIK